MVPVHIHYGAPFLLMNLKQLIGAVLRSPDIGSAAVAKWDARQQEKRNQFEEGGGETTKLTQVTAYTYFHHLVLL